MLEHCWLVMKERPRSRHTSTRSPSTPPLARTQWLRSLLAYLTPKELHSLLLLSPFLSTSPSLTLAELVLTKAALDLTQSLLLLLVGLRSQLPFQFLGFLPGPHPRFPEDAQGILLA